MSQEKEAARLFARALALDEGPAEFFLFLHYLLTTKPNPLRRLGDSELQDAVGTAVRTLETRAKGVIYDHAASSPRLQPMVEWLVRLVSVRNEVRGAPRVSDSDALHALRTLSSAVSEHLSGGGARESYLDSVARILSDIVSETPELALPEELDEPPGPLIVTP
jgi:hypothetical protein